ncbi:MAG: hypothetical protein IPG90_07655 [Bacteroidetes bacterium]|nr:hypothetical protein [Bacteroidota bacterium]
MRLLIFFTILSLSYSRILNAQNISAYSDYRGYLQAFDQGMFHQLEYLPVKSYKVGSSSVAYIDNKMILKYITKAKNSRWSTLRIFPTM